MKIRNGFVSNSSSTSFSIYGVMYNWDELVKIIFNNKKNLSKDVKQKLKGYLKTEETLLEFFREDPYQSIHKLFEVNGFENLQSWECEQGYFGRSWNTIKDSETGLEFKESTRKIIVELLMSLGCSEEGIEIDDITAETST